ncbi:MAG: F0F1 ATP synthase subunit B [Candidatus Methylomirabilis oxygeniifera]|uniref:ATP synthase subunit b n=1 Tax=Methylomirabilis oxygeniifera TaxID=671143 RepID=D5MLX6_METO1|nr:MAG: F0F1 ATP synthase subunit B [Candidatus Methylomirabilis oxyfera]CBE70033.1 putative Sodium-transporting two-sector ATPase [Candidatus Methylomirabilis oxyfera]
MTKDRMRLVATAACFLGLAFLAAFPVWAAEEAHGGGEQPGIINLNMTLLVQVVNFLILIAVLYKFLFTPLTQFLATRADGIKRSLEEAKAAREAAAQTQKEYEAQILATRREAAAMRESAIREVEEERQRLLKVSREEATRLVTEAKAQIEQEVKRAKAELRAEVVGLSLGVAERVIARSLTTDDHRRLAEQVVAEIGSGR